MGGGEGEGRRGGKGGDFKYSAGAFSPRSVEHGEA